MRGQRYSEKKHSRRRKVCRVLRPLDSKSIRPILDSLRKRLKRDPDAADVSVEFDMTPDFVAHTRRVISAARPGRNVGSGAGPFPMRGRKKHLPPCVVRRDVQFEFRSTKLALRAAGRVLVLVGIPALSVSVRRATTPEAFEASARARAEAAGGKW